MNALAVRAVAALLVLFPAHVACAAVAWTGAGGTSWATSGSWSPAGGPAVGDTVTFGDTGATNLPGEVTSVLNATRTIGGLSFSNAVNKYHTLDLGTRTFTVAGNLSFNLDQGQNTLTTIRNGTLVVNSPFATFNVGRGVSSSSTVTADLSGLTALTASVQEVNVGASTAGGATGTLTLSPSNTITAQRLFVGATNNSGDTRGTLHLGLANTINVNEITIAKDNSNGTIDVVNGATVNLGTAAQRALLQMAVQNTNTSNGYLATLNLGNAAVNLHFDSVTVAQKFGGPGGATGQLYGGGSGTVAIGDPAARSNWYVGYSVNGGGADGTVDFSRLNTLDAYVSDFWVGRSVAGSAAGAVSLAATSTIDAANGIQVGVGNNATGTLTLGRATNTLLTNQMTVGQDYSVGTVKIAAGGTLNLGSAARRADLVIAAASTNTSSLYSGKVDLTGGTFNAFLGNLTVGQKEGGPGSETGFLIGGSGGSIDIGAAGNTANFYVARDLTGGGGATATVDLGGMNSLTANLNTLSVGTAASGGAGGTLVLPAVTSINANTILVGTGTGDSTGAVTLGRTSNTILATQITIGQDYASGSVTIPAGATINLGSPARRASISIATGTTNTGNQYTGTLDLTDATLVGYLNNVVVGSKNPLPGGEYGVFTISNHADNRVEANSITLGGPQSTGILNFGGGTLTAGGIAKGAGTGTFNWTGGQLAVGTFGTPTVAFNLANSGTGTLAPGTAASPVGTTTIYGNYTQVAAAATAIDIAGASGGAGNDQVNVNGTATLAGTLSLKLLNGFVPAVGQNFLVATYASRTGTFGFVAPPALPQDVAFQVDYASIPTQLNVRTVAPVAQNWLPAASTTTWSTPANWNAAATPGTASSLSLSNTTATARTLTVTASTTVHRVSLDGPGAPLNLEVPQGIQFGVANQLLVGANATLTGGGQVYGNVVVGAAAAAGGAPTPAGGLDSDAGVQHAGTLAPGSPTGTFRVNGALTQTPGGALKVTLAGSPASGAFGRVDVSGAATLGGTLEVVLAGGFAPAALDSFQVLASGQRTGRFSTYVNLDVPGPLTLAPIYSATDVRLIATLPGDASTNGIVGFEDLVAVAQHYDTVGGGTWAIGDFDYDGNVGFSDLVAVAQNYDQALPAAGAIPGAGNDFNRDLAAAFASVPEPSAALPAAALLLAGLAHRRRRQ